MKTSLTCNGEAERTFSEQIGPLKMEKFNLIQFQSFVF